MEYGPFIKAITDILDKNLTTQKNKQNNNLKSDTYIKGETLRTKSKMQPNTYKYKVLKNNQSQAKGQPSPLITQ
ncbi:hypothetical protein AB4251_13825 [Vibrio lentus]|uniref:Uncharacterized protein n=1 Tax=Vibrio lentus TaxID=136468 RepID=A0AB36XN45_9VIBR|nr:hypothetical protein [Vibrio lentus]MCC4835135.1 hypothetical protein [Vibrio lentus]PMI17301.1 hypothetical protein BCU51_00815 [Vibrio lentus]PMK34346.1 hypothetical protein BCU02_17760 [Vibrio lentus]PMK47995.1 hypothetical protein BCT99_14060 [Vibrio lentus]PML33235.1 hypothetical protein BCT79_14695 [Vibrio lentus]